MKTEETDQLIDLNKKVEETRKELKNLILSVYTNETRLSEIKFQTGERQKDIESAQVILANLKSEIEQNKNILEELITKRFYEENLASVLMRERSGNELSIKNRKDEVEKYKAELDEMYSKKENCLEGFENELNKREKILGQKLLNAESKLIEAQKAKDEADLYMSKAKDQSLQAEASRKAFAEHTNEVHSMRERANSKLLQLDSREADFNKMQIEFSSQTSNLLKIEEQQNQTKESLSQREREIIFERSNLEKARKQLAKEIDFSSIPDDVKASIKKGINL